MFHFTRLFRDGSIATIATLMLAIASIAGTATPAAFANPSGVVVMEETALDQNQNAPEDVRTFAWKSAVASSYGPGLWGNRTACGQILRKDTIGVAHKKMACGTRLKFQGKNGVIVHARIIDRGPYVYGRTFDLTQAMVRKMGYAHSYAFGVRTVAWDYAP
jgi:rare lipoprotein A (peptidoglycan hydrolase)